MRCGRWLARAVTLATVMGAGWGTNAMAQATAPLNSVRRVGLVPPPSGLATTYRVVLASRWQRPDLVAPCRIEGGEAVEGSIRWTGQRYEGMLRRTSRYAECGAHGPACTVNVEGGAEVQAAGELLWEAGRWMLEFRWTPARDVAVRVTGDCTASYREGLERLYRTATQRVAFELPPANALVTAELDPYPWAVEVQ